MGIKRLFSYVKDVFALKKLNYLENLTVGIDAKGWLYQAYFGQFNLEEEAKLGIIRLIEKKIKMFKENKVKFVFVLDGLQLECKEITK